MFSHHWLGLISNSIGTRQDGHCERKRRVFFLRLLVHRVEWLPSGVLRFSFEEGVKEPVSDFNGKNGSEIDLNPVEFCAESRKLVPSFVCAPEALPCVLNCEPDTVDTEDRDASAS